MHTICKQFRIEAAHQLPNHDGACAREHGHSYKAEVFLTGEPNDQIDHPKEGMVVDFADVTAVWKRLCEPLLDHQNLNVTLADQGVPVTTAENIAVWIFEMMRLDGLLPVSGVRVWETATAWAEYRP